MRTLSFIALLSLAAAVVSAATPDEDLPTAVNRATAFASERRLAEHPQWHALLHMHRDALFRYRSSIDDKDFFLHPRGHLDPYAEMTATVEAFVSEAVIDDEPAACRYPARFAFLNEHLSFSSAPACHRFDSWKEKLDPTGVSLIFSSYYMNNPASMYGHTLLKLSRRNYSATSSLLDYTVNYAAIADTRNGLVYILKGLFGGFPGRFSTEPYYIKAQQYNNMEARDLWEYELDFEQEAVDRMVAHLWEIGPTGMRYFFFNKNCSYQLLPLLDVGRPELGLSRQFRFRAIPLDTLRAVLAASGLVKSRRIRPSHMRTMIARRALLSAPEIAAAESASRDPETPGLLESISADRRSLVLDAAYDLFRYRSGFQRIQPEHLKEREFKLLGLRRSVAGQTTGAGTLSYDAEPPESGHGTGRIGLYVGSQDHSRFQEISIRPSMHDLEDDDTGFLPSSQLEMFHIRLRNQEENGVHLEEANVFEVISLIPWDPWVARPSWTVRVNAEVAHDLEADPGRSLVTGLDGGGGYALTAGNQNPITVYSLVKADFEVGDVVSKGHRLGAAAHVGILLQIRQRARIHLQSIATRFFSGGIGNRVELAGTSSIDITHNFAVRADLKRVDGHKEAMAGFNLYW